MYQLLKIMSSLYMFTTMFFVSGRLLFIIHSKMRKKHGLPLSVG